VNGDSGTSDAISRRRAKSHAVKRTIRSKEKLMQGQFHVVTQQQARIATAENRIMASARSVHVASPASIISPSVLDPFNSLAVDGNKLQEYLGQRKFISLCKIAAILFAVISVSLN
jgi:hypothetical protein